MIVAIDPGGTTGMVSDRGHALETGQEAVWRLLDTLRPKVIVYEKWIATPKEGVNYEAVEVIGIIKEWARQNGVKLESYTKHQVEHFFTNDRLKERGRYYKGSRHATDAARHLCYYLEFGKGRGR